MCLHHLDLLIATLVSWQCLGGKEAEEEEEEEEESLKRRDRLNLLSTFYISIR